ncbi:OsmC family protein [Paenibacillus polymyxa]|uniref:OsmC family protein n=1 Tax=Paenibacillus polymyxa TaxID=1406 RepID=A0A8I1IZG8_PAEPO|nr:MULTISPECIES: OsmC family protein [Paenibacillus]KAF6574202.1 OsmC family protein [Paenibacillus sp. EKM206P]KAF6588673.1 OsmC family protein [Paenibacillus sp. EKM205P]MBM0632869.1 OsmC family protein [Paenibacillus polymyxa]
MEHTFLLKADWNGGRNSDGRIEAGQLRTAISIPAEMGGPGVGTNPDEMLLGAAATCYLITLAAMMERASLPVASLALESEGIVDVTNNIFTYRRIVHRPQVQLAADATESQIEQALRLAEQAETSCMISRAVAGNVTLSTEPVVERVS